MSARVDALNVACLLRWANTEVCLDVCNSYDAVKMVRHDDNLAAFDIGAFICQFQPPPFDHLPCVTQMHLTVKHILGNAGPVVGANCDEILSATCGNHAPADVWSGGGGICHALRALFQQILKELESPVTNKVRHIFDT